MSLSFACPRLISQLYLIFVPFCSARFLLSWAWKESEDCISPTLPDLAKQLPSIALRDHVPSSLQASLLKTTRQATPKFSLFESARQAQSSPTRRPPSVGQSRHAHTLQVSLDPAGLKRPHLSIRCLHSPDSYSTTAPLNCFPAGITCAHEQAGRISPRIPL